MIANSVLGPFQAGDEAVVELRTLEAIRRGTLRASDPVPPTLATNERSAFKPLAFWGPSEGFVLINSTAVGLTRMKRSRFGLRVRVNPWVNLGERFIRVNPTDV